MVNQKPILKQLLVCCILLNVQWILTNYQKNIIPCTIDNYNSSKKMLCS